MVTKTCSTESKQDQTTFFQNHPAGLMYNQSLDYTSWFQPKQFRILTPFQKKKNSLHHHEKTCIVWLSKRMGGSLFCHLQTTHVRLIAVCLCPKQFTTVWPHKTTLGKDNQKNAAERPWHSTPKWVVLQTLVPTILLHCLACYLCERCTHPAIWRHMRHPTYINSPMSSEKTITNSQWPGQQHNSGQLGNLKQ